MGSHDSPVCISGVLFGEYTVYEALSHLASDMHTKPFYKAIIDSDDGFSPVQRQLLSVF